MEQASSSKVTVEYHDPSGVFPLVTREIANRLPLRNLNWQSHARPLRQIRSLHVEFKPDEATQASLRDPLTRLDSNDPRQNGTNTDSKRPTTATGKERRHQIPGLKTSPYLKIYVLRCDDKDTYKATERKRLRDWIRANATPDGKRENHDSFEWLILHVVIPDTIAASEPRWRENSRDSDEIKERSKSNFKLPGKSTRTVFDKLRADFNESSKTAPDRVAQIRLGKSGVPPDLLPTPAIAQTLEESPQEKENAWADLVTKFKALILIPFDARVRQYEEDIAEQESRRSLPGWNFCTFFIHKEGLAKALESVGLVEDALAIYDELALGLETVIRDLAGGNAEGTATSFEETTKDIQERILGSKSATTNGTSKTASHGETSRLFEKDYRAQIVRSQISVFDFFCYLFSRQKSLILRLAGAQLAQNEFGSNFKEGGEDLVLLAEVCWRALSFAHNSGRTLRQDLIAGSKSNAFTPHDIEALVSSWTFSLVGQVLEETNTALLELADETARPAKPQTSQAKPKRPDFGFAMGANPYPSRMSSLGLPAKRPPPSGPQSPPPEKTNLESGTYGPQGITGGEEMQVPDKPGIVELAAYRAELIMIRRKMLELVAKRRGWVAGWASVGRSSRQELEEVELDADGEPEESKVKAPDGAPKPTPPSSQLAPALATHLKTEAAFLAFFEELSTIAIRHYTTATHMKSAEKVLGDIAMLKFQQEDYANAVKYFEHVLPLYGQAAWGMMEVQAVEAFLVCLEELKKKGEWAKVAVNFLKDVLAAKMGGRQRRLVDTGEITGLLGNIVALSSELGQPMEVKMEEFFDEIELDRTIEQLSDRDGFRYRFRFGHVLEEELTVDEVSARLVRLDDPLTEIWLSSPEPLVLRKGVVNAQLQGATTTLGAFYLDRIILKAKNVHFVHKLSPEPEKTGLGITISDPAETESAKLKRPLLLLYPSERAFEAEVDLARDIQIEKQRHLAIKLHSGRNAISSLDLRLRPASAGLRLHVADAKPSAIGRRADAEPVQGQLALASLDVDSEATVNVPYTLERSTAEIVLKLEARYTTPSGTFTFLKPVRLPVALPLDVDVNDVFQHDTLFSTFTVRTTNHCPIAISHAELVESKAYAVEKAPVEMLPATIFEETPLTLVYKITRKGGKSKIAKREAPLALRVRYKPVEELVLAEVMRVFTEALTSSEYSHLQRLLLPLLRDKARTELTGRSLDAVAFYGETSVPSFDAIGWREVVATLPVAVREGLHDWLTAWHTAHCQLEVPVEDTGMDAEEARTVTLAVEVPTLDFIFTTSIVLQDADAEGEERIVKLGQRMEAEIRIRHSRLWSAARIFGPESGAKNKNADFVFDVQVEPDVWLLGGPKRKHFTLPSTDDSNGDDVMTFPLVLIPLKTGELALPSIDVQPAEVEEGNEAAATGSASCETVCESAWTVVRVVTGLATARIRIEEGNDGEGD